MFRYRAFGLSFDSELELKSPIADGPGPADVTIRAGSVEPVRHRRFPDRRAHRVDVDEARFRLTVPRAFSLSVLDGHEIVFDRLRGGDDQIESSLWVDAIAAVLLQRGQLGLHASMVRMPRGAVAVAGAVGAGKTTMLAALLERGATMMADDVSVVSTDSDGAALGHPGLPVMQVNADIRSEFGLAQVDRAEVHSRSAVRVSHFETAPLSVSEVYMIGPSGDGAINAKWLDGVAAFSALARGSYGLEYIEGLGVRAEHTRAVAEVAAVVDVCELRVPHGMDCVRRVAEAIENDAFR